MRLDRQGLAALDAAATRLGFHPLLDALRLRVLRDERGILHEINPVRRFRAPSPNCAGGSTSAQIVEVRTLRDARAARHCSSCLQGGFEAASLVLTNPPRTVSDHAAALCAWASMLAYLDHERDLLDALLQRVATYPTPGLVTSLVDIRDRLRRARTQVGALADSAPEGFDLQPAITILTDDFAAHADTVAALARIPAVEAHTLERFRAALLPEGVCAEGFVFDETPVLLAWCLPDQPPSRELAEFVTDRALRVERHICVSLVPRFVYDLLQRRLTLTRAGTILDACTLPPTPPEALSLAAALWDPASTAGLASIAGALAAARDVLALTPPTPIPTDAPAVPSPRTSRPLAATATQESS